MLTEEKVISTTCPFCGVGCRLDLHIQGSQILRATTPYDHVVSRGNLCVKGRFGWDFIYHPNRVLKPLIRKPSQRAGHRAAANADDWREATWDEALELVALAELDRLRRLPLGHRVQHFLHSIERPRDPV